MNNENLERRIEELEDYMMVRNTEIVELKSLIKKIVRLNVVFPKGSNAEARISWDLTDWLSAEKRDVPNNDAPYCEITDEFLFINEKGRIVLYDNGMLWLERKDSPHKAFWYKRYKARRKE